jgi:chorismate mutase
LKNHYQHDGIIVDGVKGFTELSDNTAEQALEKTKEMRRAIDREKSATWEERKRSV